MVRQVHTISVYPQKKPLRVLLHACPCVRVVTYRATASRLCARKARQQHLGPILKAPCVDSDAI